MTSAEIVRLNAAWTVIVDEKRKQWILTRRDPDRLGDLKLYCDRKEHLLERIRHFAGAVDAGAVNRIKTWPDTSTGGQDR